MKRKTLIALTVISLIITSCSSSVQITSEPPGAEVEINGQQQGRTPMTIELSDLVFEEYRVRLKKEGYKDKSNKLQKEFKAGTFVGGLFIWPFLFWCYGPAPAQNYTLEKESNTSR